ncbi:MAG: MBL fold metallo-hydrolase [Bacteroidales bacterium]|nr:MBL fold metallo-hydrolase [Bacteroidales bacterium]
MIAVLIILSVVSLIFLFLINRFNTGQKTIQDEWNSATIKPVEGFGSTKKLEIIPLIDWLTVSDDFIGEPGVSYLIKTDKSTILFDVGFNKAGTIPSPLLKNMKKLDIDISDFDTVFISHNHLDHVGGMKNQKKKTFSLGDDSIDLSNKKIFTPIPMTYQGKNTGCNPEPFVLEDGIVSIGSISNFDFFMGRIDEQAIAVNVEGKGIVIIVGCGHQGLKKIIERTEALFKQPIYGIIGGLHYPVTDSRIKIAGIKMQKFLGTCREPWNPYSISDVAENIAFLKQRKPSIVAVSAHDSCDTSLENFRSAFPTEYRDIIVGKTIEVI